MERERQVEEKAQFFSGSYCEGLRERMMGMGEGKTEVVGGGRTETGKVSCGGGDGGREGSGARDLRESGWVGGTGSDSASARDRAREHAREQQGEKGKQRMSSLNVIEQELANATRHGNGAGAQSSGSPVSSLTSSRSAKGCRGRDNIDNGSNNNNDSNSSTKASLTALPTPRTENWKVFRGSREIQPYQPTSRHGSQRRDGEGQWQTGSSTSVWGRVRGSLRR